MKVVLIEDNRDIAEYISLAFRVGWQGTELLQTRLGEEGVALVEKESPDLVLLDVGLPDIDGFAVLKQIRRFSAVPITIITVRGDEADIVRGLEWGADEYIVKPFGQMELLARVRAILRRQADAAGGMPSLCGPFRFAPDMRNIIYRDRTIRVTATEYAILRHLAENTGRVVPNQRLAEIVWGDCDVGVTDAIRVYIRRLRVKLEDDPSNPRLILTRAGAGYLLAGAS